MRSLSPGLLLLVASGSCSPPKAKPTFRWCTVVQREKEKPRFPRRKREKEERAASWRNASLFSTASCACQGASSETRRLDTDAARAPARTVCRLLPTLSYYRERAELISPRGEVIRRDCERESTQ